MEIIKPNTNKYADCLDNGDAFFTHSHGLVNKEFTLCGIACEEWGYEDYQPRKRITCPKCLGMIRLCREYKL